MYSFVQMTLKIKRIAHITEWPRLLARLPSFFSLCHFHIAVGRAHPHLIRSTNDSFNVQQTINPLT